MSSLDLIFDRNKIHNLYQTEILASLAGVYALRMLEAAGSVNDTVTRETLVLDFDKILTSYTAMRYFEEASVVCDMSNNTPEWIQGNNLCLVDVYIRFTKASQDIWHLKFPLEFR